MKSGIHPKWYPEAQVICACGNTWTTGATVPEIRTDVCSACHPFYSGEQRIVDTEGQVDRFIRRLRARDDALQEVERQKSSRTSPDLPLAALELGARLEGILGEAVSTRLAIFLTVLNEKGDDGLTGIRGGLKALADIKKGLRARGIVLPGDEAPVGGASAEEAPAAAAA